MPEFNVDSDVATEVVAEVVRASGEREYFRVYIDGSQAQHVPISKEEYIELGGEVQPQASNIVSDLPVGKIKKFKNINSGELVEAAILEEDIMAGEDSFWVSSKLREESLGVEFGIGNVVLKYEDGNIAVMAPHLFEREFKLTGGSK